MKNQTAIYVLDEVKIQLFGPGGAAAQSAYADNVGVTVDFHFTPGDEFDSPQVTVNAVKVAGCALDVGDEGKATLNLWMGFDLLPYLLDRQIDLICEELIDRHEKAIEEQRGEV